MAEENKLLAQDFERLLRQLSPDNQNEIIKAVKVRGVNQIAKILGSSASEAEKYLDAGEAYFLEPDFTSEAKAPDVKKENKHENRDMHEQHAYHSGPSESSETTQSTTLSDAQVENTLSNESTPNALANQTIPNQLLQPSSGSQLRTEYEPNILKKEIKPNTFPAQPASPHFQQLSTRPNSLAYLRQRGKRANRRYGSGGFASSIAKNAAKKGAKKSALWTASWVLANPWVLAGISAFVVIIIFIVIVAANVCQFTNGLPLREFWAPALHQLCATETETFPPPPPGFSWDKEAVGEAADGEIGNGEPIEYRITVTFDPSKALSDIRLDQINLVDEPHYGHQTPTVETQPYRYDGQLVYWTMSDFFNLDDGIQEKEFNLSVVPDVTDREVINYSYIESPGATGGIGSGENSTATNDTCGGKYTDIMRAISNDFNTPNSNFGDPVCSYSQPKLEELIRQTETPQHVNQGYVDFWMEMTTKCEAPNNGPNSYTRSSNPATIQGAWGLFQMGSSFTDGKPDPMKPNNQESTTRGDVTWQQQVKNAINRNNNVNNESFEYFGSAMCLCWWPEHRNKDYCRAIINNGPRSNLGPRAPERNCPSGTGLTCDTRVKCGNNSCRP